MRRMGWSWQELLQAPYDLIDRIILDMNAESKVREENRKKK